MCQFSLKRLSKDAIKAAQIKAVRYRVLNEPGEAESICRDILEVEPDNQSALVTLFLALTDQFPRGLGGRFEAAEKLIDRMDGEYEQAYYSGILCERRAKSKFRKGTPGCGAVTYDWLRRSMEWFEKAEALRVAGNDDAILRWNTCVRLIQDYPEIKPEEESQDQSPLMLE